MARHHVCGCDDVESKMNGPVHATAEPTKSSEELEHDADVMVDEVLAQRGPQLLQAYQNPQVDFIETLADAFGMNSSP